MAIKSIFERFADEFDRSSKREVDFATAYSNAANQRANAQRMFEESMRQDDQNQRMWSQEERASEIYKTYQKQMNAYGLSATGRADEIGIAGQPGALASKKFNSDVLTSVATPENLARRIEIENNQSQKNAELSRAWNLMTQQEKDLIAKNPNLATLLSSTITQEGLTPEAAKRRADTAKFSDDLLQKMLGGSPTSPLDTESLNVPGQSFTPYASPTKGAGAGRGYVNPPSNSTQRENHVAGKAGNSANQAAMPNSEQLSAQTNIWQQQLAQLIDNANNLKKANQLTPELASATRQKVDSLRGLIAQNQNLMQIAKASEAQNALRLMIGQNQ